jgi:hypothetical protein
MPQVVVFRPQAVVGCYMNSNAACEFCRLVSFLVVNRKCLVVTVITSQEVEIGV